MRDIIRCGCGGCACQRCDGSTAKKEAAEVHDPSKSMTSEDIAILSVDRLWEAQGGWSEDV